MAYQLVHEVYVQTGFINPQPQDIRLRMFEAVSETATFVAKVDGQIVGVLTVVADSGDLGLPSDVSFAPELNGLRDRQLRVGELTNQVVAPNFRKSSVATELMRCAIAHAIETQLDVCIASVSPSHQPFYDLIGFEALGSLRSYSTEIYDPVIALQFDITQFRLPCFAESETGRFIHHELTTANPFLEFVLSWAERARSEFTDPHTLGELLVHNRNFVSECSAEELKVLRNRWGAELFAALSSLSRITAKEIQHSLPSHASSAAGIRDHDLSTLFAEIGAQLDRATDVMCDQVDRALSLFWSSDDFWRVRCEEAGTA